MANEVYVNTRDICCKDAEGKSICSFPDVCLSPPSPPAGPVPIPYPNTGMASDTTDGSKTVQVGGKEVMLKDKSYFKKSTGDEAATKSLGMGVVTHQIQGKVYFAAWSMDVVIEGENAVRHLDLTTHNHNTPPNTPPWPYTDRMAMAKGLRKCNDEREAVKTKCDPWEEKAKCKDESKAKNAEEARLRVKRAWQKVYGDDDKGYKDDPQYKRFNTIAKQEYGKLSEEYKKDDCHKALRCILVPYKEGCCPGQTPHHVVEGSSFLDDKGETRVGWKKYDYSAAPCVCTEGPNQTTATHGEMHVRQGVVAEHKQDANGEWSRKEATDSGVNALQKTFPESGCSEECLKAQLDRFHDNARTATPDKPIRAVQEMTSDETTRAAARAEMGVPAPVSTR